MDCATCRLMHLSRAQDDEHCCGQEKPSKALCTTGYPNYLYYSDSGSAVLRSVVDPYGLWMQPQS